VLCTRLGTNISPYLYTSHPIPSTPTQCTHRLPCKHATNPANVIYRMQERECQPTDTLAVRRMEMLSMLNKCPSNNEAWGIYGPNRNSLVAKSIWLYVTKGDDMVGKARGWSGRGVGLRRCTTVIIPDDEMRVVMFPLRRASQRDARIMAIAQSGSAARYSVR
jgi:hypothetical protein